MVAIKAMSLKEVMLWECIEKQEKRAKDVDLENINI